MLLERYPLRSYGAAHLATALAAQQSLQHHGLPSLTFVSADSGLNAVAIAAGLAVSDPNQAP